MALLTSNWGLDGILILLSAIVAAYMYMTRNFRYWAKRGVMEIPPNAFVGNFADCLMSRMSIGEYIKDLYEKSRGSKYMGLYIFDKPFLLLRDPAIIKNVLVKDFSYFANRHMGASDKDVLGTVNLFAVRSPHWRNLRSKLSPTFSIGKMKKMFYLMFAVTENLGTHFEALDLDGDDRMIELKEITARYTTDMISSCAFGLKVNSLNNPNAEFRNHGRKFFTFTYRRSFEVLSIFFVPALARFMGFKLFENDITDFLRNAVWGTIKARMESGDHRNDLIDTLIELKQAQAKTDVDDPEAFEFDGDNLVAQAAVFFTAGFETSATTIIFSMYELALQPDLQARLRKEIDSALEECEEKLTYETVMNLPYLDMVVSETLRKYPPLPFLERVAVREYKVPTTDLVIEKGTPVYTPIFGLHYDPKYFPEPQKYDPERFSEENKQKIPSYVYMPFGEGPRNCVGGLFGLLQTKLGMIKILSKYELTPCSQTLVPMRFDPKSFTVAPAGGLYLHVRKITTAAG